MAAPAGDRYALVPWYIGRIAARATITTRFAFASTRTGEVIAFCLHATGLVPKHSIDMAADAGPVAAPELDMGRASLWLLAECVEREHGIYELHPYDSSDESGDESGEGPAVDLHEVDHHLLVLEGRPGPVLQAAIEAGEVEEPFSQAFVTRRPVALSVARRWAAEATLVCAFGGRGNADHVLASSYVQDLDGDMLRYIRVTVPDRIRVEALPPEWAEALAVTTLDLDTPTEHIVLTDVCTEVRAVDPDGSRPANAAALEAEFQELLVAPTESTDSWPEGIVRGDGLELPDDGPGRTVCLTRSRLRALLGQPWRSCFERERVTLYEGWSSRVLAMGEAEARLAGNPWRALAATRENARRSGWRRAQLVVYEWLFHTGAGRRHRDARDGEGSDPSRSPPVEAFAVGARGLSFLGDDVARSRVHEMTAKTVVHAWSLDPRKLRERAPQAELVLMFRRWNDEHGGFEYVDPPLYLASSHDGPTAIRRAVVRAGGRVAES